MKETYNFEFWRWNFNCDNFKQRPAQILINTIIGGRLVNDMEFESYGHIEFAPEDKSNRYPTVSYLDDFTRSKTNCLIFNLKETDKNKNYYNSEQHICIASKGIEQGSCLFIANIIKKRINISKL